MALRNMENIPVLEQYLASLSQAQLLDLIWQLCDESKEVRTFLLNHINVPREIINNQPSNDDQVEQLKEEIKQIFDELEELMMEEDEDEYRYDYDYEDEDEEILEPKLDSVFETARFLNLADQVQIYWEIISTGTDLFDRIEDFTIGTTQIEKAFQFFAETIQNLELSPLEKQPYLRALVALFDRIIFSDRDIRKAIKNAMELICDVPEDYYYLISQMEPKEAEAIDWITGYYLKLADHENYLRVRSAHLEQESDYLELAKYWQQKGNSEKYLATLEQWIINLDLDPKSSNYGLRRFSIDSYHFVEKKVFDELTEYYRQQKDDDNLSRILLKIAEHRYVTLDLYKEVKELGNKLGKWPEMQVSLIKYAEKHDEILAKIYLYEENWDKALEITQKSNIHEGIQVVIAEGVKQNRPFEAIAIYEKIVEYNIDQRKRDRYRQSATYANKIKAIYLQVLNDPDGWHRYLSTIRENHRRLPALIDEFRSF